VISSAIGDVISGGVCSFPKAEQAIVTIDAAKAMGRATFSLVDEVE